MQNIIKNYTPLYNINFGWKTLKLSRFFSPRLKLSVPDLKKCGVVYEFTCFCSSKYVGETYKQLSRRIQQHQQPSRKTAISLHIESCGTYQWYVKQKRVFNQSLFVVGFLEQMNNFLGKAGHFIVQSRRRMRKAAGRRELIFSVVRFDLDFCFRRKGDWVQCKQMI